MVMRNTAQVVLWRSCIAVAIVAGLASPSRGQTPTPTITTFNGVPAVADEILIRLRTASTAAAASIQTVAPAATVGALNQRLGLYRVRVPGQRLADLLQAFSQRPEVLYAEPNYIVQAVATPNDPWYSLLYGMSKIDGPAAWDITTGGTSAVVGVVDTGIDFSHPDLAANIWSAPAAFTVNIDGVDIDCPAGSHGFDAITKSCDPSDDHNHGTHVSGTIGGVGDNGVGVAGVNWTAQIMGLKFLNAFGSGTTADAVSAIEFAIQVKRIFAGTATPVDLRVLSNSWGGGGYSQALLDTINAAGANEMLFVVAAGNSAADTEAYSFYPASYTAPNVVTVAATDSTDALAYFSNFGATTVHLGAPGVNTYSTIRTASGSYGYFSGTSMATPHVSGAALLALALCPSLTTTDLKRLVLNSTDPDSFLTDRTISGGRLNVAKMVEGCRATSVAPSSGLGSTQPFTFTVSDPDGAGDIDSAEMLFGTSVGSADVCHLRFVRSANAMWLRLDSTTWIGPAVLGTAGVLSNSLCSVDVGHSSSSINGNVLTARLAMNLLPAFGGAKSIFLNVTDSTAIPTPWQKVGQWAVPGNTNLAPSALTVRAASGSGQSRLFSYRVSDPDGGNDVASAQILINAGLSASNGCWLYFAADSRQVWLRDAANSSWLGPATFGASDLLSNGLCTVYPGASSSWSTDDSLLVNVFIAFTSQFGGTKSNYLLAIDSAGHSTNWRSVGTWTVNVPNYYPYPVSVTPSSGAGQSQAFRYVITDSNGANDIVSAGFLVNSSSSVINACYLVFYQNTNQLYLLNDAGATYLGPVTPGTAGSLSNSQCSVNAAASSSSTSGNDLTVTLALTFTGAFAGSKTLYAQATDRAGAASGLYYLGTWVVPGPPVPPVAQWVSPSSSTGAGTSFLYLATDQNGATDITSVQILLNGGLGATNACWLYVERASNRVWLRDNGNTSWLGPVTMGSTGALTNGQCTVNAASSWMSTSTTSLYVDVNLTFDTAFAGPKSNFMYVADSTGASSGWRALGTYTVIGPTAPQAMWVSPSAGSGASTPFYYAFSDANGVSDIVSTQMLIGSALNGANACWVYVVGTTLYLASDSGTSWLSPVSLGSAGTTENSQCAIDAGASFVSSGGNYLYIYVNVTFRPAFRGPKSNFMLALDRSGLSSGWQARGTWTVP
jgi:subtilisin family serine protease